MGFHKNTTATKGEMTMDEISVSHWGIFEVPADDAEPEAPSVGTPWKWDFEGE